MVQSLVSAVLPGQYDVVRPSRLEAIHGGGVDGVEFLGGLLNLVSGVRQLVLNRPDCGPGFLLLGLGPALTRASPPSASPEPAVTWLQAGA